MITERNYSGGLFEWIWESFKPLSNQNPKMLLLPSIMRINNILAILVFEIMLDNHHHWKEE